MSSHFDSSLLRTLALVAAFGLASEMACAAPGSPGPRADPPGSPPAAASPVAPAPSGRTAAGAWGGRGIGLSAAGGEEGRLELDCAHATVPQPLAVGEDGRFEWRGTWFSEGGGPTREGRSDGRSIRLRGHIEGDAMTLVIETPDAKDTLGTFTLRRNGPARIRKCS